MTEPIVDARLRTSLLGHLTYETFQLTRPNPQADGEGNPQATPPARAIRGTMGTPSRPDHTILLAEQRGTRVDKILSVTLETDILAGDFVTTAAGLTYEVIMLDVRRLYQRALVQVLI